jgi:hypothetical protein
VGALRLVASTASRAAEHSRGLARECALAGTAAGAYVLREASDYDFALPACWSSSADLFRQPPFHLGPLIAVAGRYSLEIYALSLVTMQVLAQAGEA